jgi:dTDP-4-amino-4,6-dideoxygalactose transaminase
VALAQIHKLERLVRARQKSADMLCQRLRDIPGIVVPAVGNGTKPAWWIFNFCIDHEVLPCSADAFCDALLCEGLSLARQYLPRPLFDEEMFVENRLFGTHGYPLPENAPRPSLAEFPGLRQFFAEQIITSWSSQVSEEHVARIAQGIDKVASAVRSAERRS